MLLMKDSLICGRFGTINSDFCITLFSTLVLAMSPLSIGPTDFDLSLMHIGIIWDYSIHYRDNPQFYLPITRSCRQQCELLTTNIKENFFCASGPCFLHLWFMWRGWTYMLLLFLS